ncbi:hypothetical protein CTheo_7297 [Ceratobasidium theobromae]|uniref:Uncharacterized protein n=1 Tax=Ceratobasidium theobromae TaxID=1582974 RepID=A0A5N5QBV7_9AGAM|nr:hypothetical protein CTheo_7297 [Ceratobasidium theobromae]
MLDGRTHLVRQGWKGTGHPLKTGGRARPVVIAQKKTLGGIGKDRDESFAFWDHLYDVAAKTIKLKIPGDDSPADSDQDGQNFAVLHRTKTGILSNRQPTTLPTPSSSKSSSPPPSSSPPSILSLAKKEAARRFLYSRFLRGPVIVREVLESVSDAPAGATAGDASLGVPAASLGFFAAPSHSGSSDESSAAMIVQQEVDKTERRRTKEERRQARAGRRQAREERRKAKAIRRETKAAKEIRKVERAAKRAVKLEKRLEKERKRAQARVDIHGGEKVGTSDFRGGGVSAVGGKREKDKKYRRGQQC